MPIELRVVPISSSAAEMAGWRWEVLRDNRPWRRSRFAHRTERSAALAAATARDEAGRGSTPGEAAPPR